jgi:hypothetical protein
VFRFSHVFGRAATDGSGFSTIYSDSETGLATTTIAQDTGPDSARWESWVPQTLAFVEVSQEIIWKWVQEFFPYRKLTPIKFDHAFLGSALGQRADFRNCLLRLHRMIDSPLTTLSR